MQLKDLIDANGHCDIPEGTTAIPADAFRGCTALASVRIPDSCTRIGDCAFYGCTALASVRIPDSVTEIGDWAFHGCASLESVVVPASVTSIGALAFSRCTALPSVELAHHTAVRVSGDWLQCGCKCARLGWWESEKGREFAEENEYTEAEYEAAIEQLRQLCACKT